MSRIDALPPLREVIATHGLQARAALGQNFILDLQLMARIVRHMGAISQCDVLEIGPGPGGLTRALLAHGARRVVAVEKDPRCLPALEQIAKACPGRLHIIRADARRLDPQPYLNPPVRIAANLPYNIGTMLLVRWLTQPRWPPFWHSLTLMFQREVAERIVAEPNSPAYGRLAVLAQWRCKVRLVMSLPPEVFTPRPKVNSALVHITALPQPRFPADAEVLSRVVAAAFQQRRKMLRSALRGVAPDVEGLLCAAGIAPTCRAENISPEEFCALARVVQAWGLSLAMAKG